MTITATRTCARCGAPNTRHGQAVYCSDACKRAVGRERARVSSPAQRVGYHRPETASIRDVYKVEARELCDPCKHLRNGVCLLGHERARMWSWAGRECPDWQ